jgi:hypothetical protein
LPIALSEGSPVADAFRILADSVVRQIAIRNANIDPTRIVEIKQ